jgi:hypothetical protein
MTRLQPLLLLTAALALASPPLGVAAAQTKGRKDGRTDGRKDGKTEGRGTWRDELAVWSRTRKHALDRVRTRWVRATRCPGSGFHPSR